MDLEQVLQAFRGSFGDQATKPGHDFYNACLDRINQIITERNANIDKTQIVQILRDLSYYRPKEDELREKMRKEQGALTQEEIDQEILSQRHKQLINQNKDKFITVPEHMFNFVYTNLSKGLLKDLFTHKEEKQQSKLKVSLHDVLANYIELYDNLSIRVIDMGAQGLFDSRDALDMLVSYAIAEEGSNTLYIRLIELLIRRTEEYNIVEIEMILNYFPHQIWGNDDGLTHLKDQFYYPIIKKLDENVSKLNKRQFLSIFQGLSLTDSTVFNTILLNKFLNSFAQKLKENPQNPTEQFKVHDILTFLELYIQYIRTVPKLQEMIDSQTLIDYSNEKVIEPNITSLSVNQISGLYWIYHNTRVKWKEQTISLIEERLSKLLREEILLQKQLDKHIQGDEKEGLQSMNLYDLDVIEHYYSINTSLQEASKRQREILKLIQQAKHWDKPEKERKWFHF